MDEKFLVRAHDQYGVKYFVHLPKRDYADLLARTRLGKCVHDFHDEDGLCTFELRDGDLYLRTAQGELKVVVTKRTLRLPQPLRARRPATLPQRRRKTASADGEEFASTAGMIRWHAKLSLRAI